MIASEVRAFTVRVVDRDWQVTDVRLSAASAELAARSAMEEVASDSADLLEGDEDGADLGDALEDVLFGQDAEIACFMDDIRLVRVWEGHEPIDGRDPVHRIGDIDDDVPPAGTVMKVCGDQVEILAERPQDRQFSANPYAVAGRLLGFTGPVEAWCTIPMDFGLLVYPTSSAFRRRSAV